MTTAEPPRPGARARCLTPSVNSNKRDASRSEPPESADLSLFLPEPPCPQSRVRTKARVGPGRPGTPAVDTVWWAPAPPAHGEGRREPLGVRPRVSRAEGPVPQPRVSTGVMGGVGRPPRLPQGPRLPEPLPACIHTDTWSRGRAVPACASSGRCWAPAGAPHPEARARRQGRSPRVRAPREPPGRPPGQGGGALAPST